MNNTKPDEKGKMQPSLSLSHTNIHTHTHTHTHTHKALNVQEICIHISLLLCTHKNIRPLVLPGMCTLSYQQQWKTKKVVLIKSVEIAPTLLIQ